MADLEKTESGVRFVYPRTHAVDGDTWIAGYFDNNPPPSCDFVWRRTWKDAEVVELVEAKSSSPQPGNGLTDYCSKLAQKLNVTAARLLAVYAGRCPPKALDQAPELRSPDAAKLRWRFVLIVPAHDARWLPPLRDALREEVRSIAKAFVLDDEPRVLNEALARKHGYLPSS